MNLSNLKELIVDGIKLVELKINGVLAWKSGYKNWVKYSTESDGVTIYNGGLGYKDGYRVRSGGAEAAQKLTTVTGYIPYVKGDKLYIYPPFTGKNSTNAVNFFDISFSCLGQVVDTGGGYGSITGEYKTKLVNGVSVLDISSINTSTASSVAYVRITNNLGWDDGAMITSGAEMIITKNEEIV